MRYKILTFDGRYVDRVGCDEIFFRKTPRLLDICTTMEMLMQVNLYQQPYERKRKKFLAKCELETVEVTIIRPGGVI